MAWGFRVLLLLAASLYVVASYMLRRLASGEAKAESFDTAR